MFKDNTDFMNQVGELAKRLALEGKPEFSKDLAEAANTVGLPSEFFGEVLLAIERHNPCSGLNPATNELLTRTHNELRRMFSRK